MITYIKGDLLKADTTVIAHGCNCQKTMGAGVAKYVAQMFPEAKRADRNDPRTPKQRLGTIVSVKVGRHSHIEYVVNCYTQLKPGNHRHGKVTSKAITTTMKSLYEFCMENDYSVAIPRIGSKRGRGNWDTIENIINDVFQKKEIKIYYNDSYKPRKRIYIA